LKREQTQKQRG